MIVHQPLAPLLADPILARHVPFVAVVDDVLAPAECAAELARIEALGPSAAGIRRRDGEVMDTRVRNNDRVIFDDAPLAERLFARLRSAVPPHARGLNWRFRGYRYAPGQRFAPHRDGTVVVDDLHSEITVLVYLNGDCEGGQTRFLDWDLTVTPRAGMALLFQHDVVHEGCPVTSGRKYVLRSDVFF